MKLSERAIEDEIEDNETDFNIQRLGLWITYNQKSVISKQEWKKLCVETLPKFKGQLGVGIKFNKDGSSVSLAVAVKTDEDKRFVEVIDCHNMRDGLDWIISFLLPIKDQYLKVVADGANGFEMLSRAMKDAKLKPPIAPTTKEYIDANAKFEQLMFQDELRHMEQPSVEDIITNCDKRVIGTSGGFGYKSIKLSADISIMDSMILALWCLDEFSGKKKQTIRY